MEKIVFSIFFITENTPLFNFEASYNRKFKFLNFITSLEKPSRQNFSIFRPLAHHSEKHKLPVKYYFKLNKYYSKFNPEKNIRFDKKV